MLDIVASYHRIQFQGKLMIQTQENDKQPVLGPDLGTFSFFFFGYKTSS